MKKIIFMSTAACLFLGFSLADMWDELGLSEAQGQDFITNCIMYSGSGTVTQQMKKLDETQRVKMINQLGAYIKKFCASDDFKKSYAAAREERKPQQPDLITKSGQEQLNDQDKAMLDGIQNTEEAIKKTSDATMKKSLQDALDMQKKMYAEMKKQNYLSATQLDTMTKTQNAETMRKYNEDSTKWENDYPADEKMFLKKRIQQFLDETSGVDFNAKLEERYGRKIFVNPGYESKNSNWKKAFRAGKAVTEGARDFAIRWLKELK